MKKNFRIAALAVAACGLMVACNNNAPAELVDTVVPIDTMVVEEIIDTMPVVDTPVVEQPVVKKAAPKKAATKKAETPTNVATKASIKSQKKSINEVKPEDMKVVKSESTSTKSLNPNSKPNPADVFKKN